jgi:hypothetical protein
MSSWKRCCTRNRNVFNGRNVGNTINRNSLDRVRSFSDTIKDAVWNDADTCDGFDGGIFRKDVLGNVCINRTIELRGISTKFNYDYEHIISYSNGGPTVLWNCCLLNSSINQSKRDIELYHHNFNEISGLKARFGISIDFLVNELNDNLDAARIKYNLYFDRNASGNWSITDFPEPVIEVQENAANDHDNLLSIDAARIYIKNLFHALGVKDTDLIDKIEKAALVGSMIWTVLPEGIKEEIRHNARYIYDFISTELNVFIEDSKPVLQTVKENLDKIDPVHVLIQGSVGVATIVFTAIMFPFVLPEIIIGSAILSTSGIIVGAAIDITLFDRNTIEYRDSFEHTNARAIELY